MECTGANSAVTDSIVRSGACLVNVSNFCWTKRGVAASPGFPRLRVEDEGNKTIILGLAVAQGPASKPRLQKLTLTSYSHLVPSSNPSTVSCWKTADVAYLAWSVLQTGLVFVIYSTWPLPPPTPSLSLYLNNKNLTAWWSLILTLCIGNSV